MIDDRRAIRARLEAGLDRGAYATVAPLLDRFSAAEVAVTLQSLWSEARTKPAPSPAPSPAPRVAAHPKVWINIGKKDGVSHGELLALLTLDLSLPRTALGKLEMKDTFTLIELTSDEDARRAVERLAGHTFKQRRLTARIDRGRDPRRAP
jgi:ATP-dependent RNA helicase DeaD